MFDLVPYQDDAVNDLINGFKELLRTQYENTQIVFKSPTGSGKTIMVAEMLKRLAFEELPQNYVFVWASMYKLHDQSREKLDEYLNDSRYNLIGIEELGFDSLLPNTILFTNWESVIKTDRETGEWSNKAVRQGEQPNIIDALSAAKAEGLEVILIVDEAHQTYLGEKSQKFVKAVLQPKLILEVSATPQLNPSGEDISDNKARVVKVPFEEVVHSGLIKQETRINHEIDEHLDDGSSDEAVIEAALKRRQILEEQYKEEGTDVKPLVLIQLPKEDTERTSVLDKNVKTKIEEYLAAQGITYENGRLAVWLSEEKRNKDRIEEPNSPVEMLIFKKAVATGWDCPRAQILVMLSDMQSPVFRIQTVGRILRTPEAKHYTSSDLNAAYVYTNLGSIVVDHEDEDALSYIKLKSAKIREDIENINIPSVYMHRTDYHDLTASFRPILFKHLNKAFGISNNDLQETVYQKIDTKLELYPEELRTPIISDVTVENLDEIDNQNIESKITKSTLDNIHIEHLFNYIIKSWTAPYNYTRSAERLKPALYEWFARAGYNIPENIDEIQRIIVCSEKNQQILTSAIESAKNEFEDTRHEDVAQKRAITPLTFKIPEIDQFGENYTAIPSDKHALEPYYAHNNRPNTEKFFEAQVDKSDKVEWWYKNGESIERYFAVSFISEDRRTGVKTPASFYPDYIIKYNDGSIGIYDTKAGHTTESHDTKLKSDALQEYIVEQNKKGLELKGGIIDVNTADKTMYICDDPDYSADDLDKWRVFNEL